MIRILTLLIFATFSSLAFSQGVFNMMIENADRTINNPSSGYALTSIAHFKKTALIYMKNMAAERNVEKADSMLDTQAYYLSLFTKTYVEALIKSKVQTLERQKELVNMFIGFSKKNPLFNDDNTEVTDTYINDYQTLTPFSLDTDWEKAFETAKNAQIE